MREGMFNEKCWELIKYGKEVFSLGKEGVSLVRIYEGGSIERESGGNPHL